MEETLIDEVDVLAPHVLMGSACPWPFSFGVMREIRTRAHPLGTLDCNGEHPPCIPY